MTSKVPTLANWSRDTTIRVANQVFGLTKYKPEEFQVFWNVIIPSLLGELQLLQERNSRLSTENVDLFIKVSELEEKMQELEQKLKHDDRD